MYACALRGVRGQSPALVTCLPVLSLAVIFGFMGEVTQILDAIERGDSHAAKQLLPLVYDELRRLAAQKMTHEKPGQTLDATALVHEAYLRLVKTGGERQPPGEKHGWEGRRHFFGAAAEAMRRILIENARRKSSRKHGGGRERIKLEAADVPVSQQDDELTSLNEALTKLAEADPAAAELVKLCHFAGLSIPQAAEMLGMGARSADRLWAYARAWLRDALGAD
jgi:RNA polymerase sigma factor (TIGR02999 family)